MKVLVVEDDKDIAKVLGIGLRNERMTVHHAPNAVTAINMAVSSTYDVILLDYMLPGKDGDEVCRVLRNAKVKSAIIALTCMEDVKFKLRMFNSGADDYIVKPFDFDELFARMRLALRKNNVDGESVLVFEDLKLDMRSYELSRGDQEITLRDKELRLLEYFMRHPGQVLTREMILNYVWGGHIERYTNVVDVHIHNLRDKIDKPFGTKNLKTINNVGYKLSR